MSHVFVLNGSGGVGKDTFVNLIQKYHEKTVHLSSINCVKEIAAQMGWQSVKDEKSRKFLSDLKKIWNEYNDGPFQDILQECAYREWVDDMWIFIDIREPQEIARFVYEKPDTKTILMTNKNVPVIKSNKSDSDVDAYKYDIMIRNDGSMDDLKKLVDEFIIDLEQDCLKEEYNIGK